jgi:hypothetical protein
VVVAKVFRNDPWKEVGLVPVASHKRFELSLTLHGREQAALLRN